MLARHRAADTLPTEPDMAVKETQRIARLERDAAELRAWLAAHPEDRRGPTGGIRKSNRSDNDSAKMATSKDVLQGYDRRTRLRAGSPILNHGRTGFFYSLGSRASRRRASATRGCSSGSASCHRSTKLA